LIAEFFCKKNLFILEEKKMFITTVGRFWICVENVEATVPDAWVVMVSPIPELF
jgi:hypothetical protein